MASLMKVSRLFNSLTSQNKGCLYNVVRSKVYTNEDWMPGPYPKTEKERRKAAEKYGLHPDEYEPYPDDGWGLGDYPKLADIGRAKRDPYYPWDDPVMRRNFQEPFHRHYYVLGEDRLDSIPDDTPHGVAWKYFLGAFGIFASIYLFFEYFDISQHHNVMEKQYPKPGVVHYTFEPER